MSTDDTLAEPPGLAALPEPLRARVEAELAPGERLLWASLADPRPPAALMHPAKPGSIFLIAAGAFVAVWMIGARQASSAQPVDSAAFLMMVFLTGITALIAGFVTKNAWSDRRRNGRPECRECYALTDRRVVVWGPADRAGGVEVSSIEPDATAAVHRLEYPDGSGEVRIRFVAEDNEADVWPPRALLGIADVRRVESSMRAVLMDRSIPREPAGRPIPGKPRASLDPDFFEEPF